LERSGPGAAKQAGPRCFAGLPAAGRIGHHIRAGQCGTGLDGQPHPSPSGEARCSRPRQPAAGPELRTDRCGSPPAARQGYGDAPAALAGPESRDFLLAPAQFAQRLPPRCRLTDGHVAEPGAQVAFFGSRRRVPLGCCREQDRD
jgi:hypothetical protein